MRRIIRALGRSILASRCSARSAIGLAANYTPEDFFPDGEPW